VFVKSVGDFEEADVDPEGALNCITNLTVAQFGVCQEVREKGSQNSTTNGLGSCPLTLPPRNRVPRLGSVLLTAILLQRCSIHWQGLKRTN
jgi:hypothetical protein